MTIQLSPTISLVPVVPAIELQLAGSGWFRFPRHKFNFLQQYRRFPWFPLVPGNRRNHLVPVVPDPVGEGTMGTGTSDSSTMTQCERKVLWVS